MASSDEIAAVTAFVHQTLYSKLLTEMQQAQIAARMAGVIIDGCSDTAYDPVRHDKVISRFQQQTRDLQNLTVIAALATIKAINTIMRWCNEVAQWQAAILPEAPTAGSTAFTRQLSQFLSQQR